jgi:hypothetical protein
LTPRSEDQGALSIDHARARTKNKARYARHAEPFALDQGQLMGEPKDPLKLTAIVGDRAVGSDLGARRAGNVPQSRVFTIFRNLK